MQAAQAGRSRLEARCKSSRHRSIARTRHGRANAFPTQLITRLNADELAHHRAFSTAAAAAATASRPTVNTASNAPTTRHFNTSRALKAVNDSSTIDFAYLPTETELLGPNAHNTTAFETVRVPIIPTNFTPTAPKTVPAATPILASVADDAAVMKPEISTMSADAAAAIAPLAELSDCHAMHVDFHAVAEDVAAPLQPRGAKAAVQEGEGVFGRIFGDMVEDLVRGRKLAF